MDMAIIAAVLLSALGNGIITVFIGRTIAQGVRSELHQLDQTIAEAISKVIEADLSHIEPPNPFAAMLAEVMKGKLNPSIEVNELSERDLTGKFVKKYK